MQTIAARAGSRCTRARDVAVLLAALGGCAAPARLPVEAGMGANPQLPQPSPSVIPALDIAPRIGWPEGAGPQTAPGFRVNAFATGLDHPRRLPQRGRPVVPLVKCSSAMSSGCVRQISKSVEAAAIGRASESVSGVEPGNSV